MTLQPDIAFIKCVVVEDDPISRAIINMLIDQHEGLALLASFSNAEEAASWFQLHRDADLVFMDIDLNGVSGINLYRQLPYKPNIIFTTAHEDFAFTAYELGAVDYLKKPITSDRFLRSLTRLKKNVSSISPADARPPSQTLFFKEGRNFLSVRFTDILFFEAARDYVKVVTAEKTHMVLITMIELERKLDPALFIRVSKSYIVNKHKVVKLDAGFVYINQHPISISRQKKQEIKTALGIE